MGLISPTNRSVLQLKGLHLYHSARSNCSARVRLLLTEKGLDWTSHHIDHLAKENITEEYFGINPKGLVPALVHDGRVIIESNDILEYLEETFPKPSFSQVCAQDRAVIDDWLRFSAEMHLPAVKTFQYYKLNAALLKKTKQEEELYQRLQTHEDLKAFHAKHSGGNSFTDDDADGAVALLNDIFTKMNKALEGNDWLVANTYTLADISWATTITTLLAGKFDFTPFPEVERWYARIYKRPQFNEAVVQWRKKADWESMKPNAQ